MKILKKIFSIFQTKNCSCDQGEYEHIKETYSNQLYKCLKCGGKEYKLKYRGGTCRINPKMEKWYIQRCFNNSFNKK